MTTYPTPWNVEATNALDHDDRTTVPMAQITAADGTPICQFRGADAAGLAERVVLAVNFNERRNATIPNGEGAAS